MKEWIVLKPTGPMNLANNAGLNIKQGQVQPHPGYDIDPDVFDIFKNYDKAIKRAARNVEEKNIMIREGITDKKSLAKAMAKKAKEPTAEERDLARESAKVLNPDGSLDDPTAKRLAELEAENRELQEELKKKRTDEAPNPNAYLDQNTRTVVKRVKTAAKKGRLTKKDVQDLVAAESEGQKRKGVLDKLKNLVKSDAIFGKLFKK